MKLFIGIPCYSAMPTYTVQSLLALQAKKPFDTEVEICQGDGVARSRNRLTASFLRSKCDAMLQIDSDLIFSPDHVARIAGHAVPVVGGLYPKKQDGPVEWVINTLPQMESRREDGLQRVKYVGTGFMCVKREVFEKMISAYPEISYAADYGDRFPEHDFWPMGVYRNGPNDPGRYLSEDWYFCQRWSDMGGEIYADCRTVLKHIGPAVFPLKSQEDEILRKCPPREETEPLTAGK